MATTTSPSIDWNDNGRYCNAQQKNVVKKGVNNIHMSTAAATSLRKITSFDDIKPNKKDLDLVIKSLYDWAVMILHRDLPYSAYKDSHYGEKCLGRINLTVIGHGIGGKYIPTMAHLAKARCWSK